MNINIVVDIVCVAKRRLVKPFFILFLWLFLFAVAPMIHGTWDFSYYGTLKTIVGQFITSGVIIVYLCRKGSKDIFIDFCRSYVYAEAFYVFMTLVIIAMPLYRSWILSNVFMRAEGDSTAYIDGLRYYMQGIMYTRIGFDGIAIYGAGLKVAIAFAIATFILSRRRILINYIAWGLCLLGAVFYARTAVVADFLVLLWFFVGKKKSSISVRSISMAMLIFLVGIFAAAIVVSRLPDETLRWIMSKDITANTMLSTTGEGFLGTHIFVPRVDSFLFGEGLFLNIDKAGYFLSDSGFMTMLLYGGVLCLLFMVSGIMELISLKRYSKYEYGRQLSIALVIVFVIFEIKGNALLFLLPQYILLSTLIGVKLENISFFIPKIKGVRKTVYLSGNHREKSATLRTDL